MVGVERRWEGPPQKVELGVVAANFGTSVQAARHHLTRGIVPVYSDQSTRGSFPVPSPSGWGDGKKGGVETVIFSTTGGTSSSPMMVAYKLRKNAVTAKICDTAGRNFGGLESLKIFEYERQQCFFGPWCYLQDVQLVHPRLNLGGDWGRMRIIAV